MVDGGGGTRLAGANFIPRQTMTSMTILFVWNLLTYHLAFFFRSQARPFSQGATESHTGDHARVPAEACSQHSRFNQQQGTSSMQAYKITFSTVVEVLLQYKRKLGLSTVFILSAYLLLVSLGG